MAIKLGDDVYEVISVTAAGVVTVQPSPGSAEPAAAYTIVIPEYRRGPFAAKVSTAGNMSLASESDLTTTITFASTALLPDVVIPGAPTS